MRGIFFLLVDETNLSFDGITWFIKPPIITIALILVSSVSWSMSDVLNLVWLIFFFFFFLFDHRLDPVTPCIHRMVKQ